MVGMRFFTGWLGPFKLLTRYTSQLPGPGRDDPGRLYQASHLLTRNPALVLIPSRAGPDLPGEGGPAARSSSRGRAVRRPQPGAHAGRHGRRAPRAPLAYPLPAQPFSDQAKAPCNPKKGQVDINGGCWVKLARNPPCYEDQAEYQGKCYLPVSARSQKPREPRTLQP